MSIDSDLPDWFMADYTKSVVEVYVDFCKYSMEAASEGHTLGFLRYLGVLCLPNDENIHIDVRVHALHHGFLTGEA